ncbi:MAG: AzlD domain-containing protein [Propionibacteriaceae bacterium]|nr:AzlD domain-containing protein [Propionibacteriaceae bacterium]
MNLWLFIAVMAGATYLLRVTPLVALRKRITNRWFLSFLHYVPYVVLTAMTVPAILFATSSVLSGAAALIVAIILAKRGASLMLVALGAALTVVVVEALIVWWP